MGKATRRRGAAFLLTAVLLSCALALAGCAGGAGGDKAGASGEGTLRVGVRSDVVGFGYLNENTGKYYGLEIDIAEELARRLGYADVEFVSVLPETRKEMLLDGQVDCLVACYSVGCVPRLENFDFSPAYYQDASIVMVENSSLVEGVEDLKGLTFGTMAGSNTAPQLAHQTHRVRLHGRRGARADRGPLGHAVRHLPPRAACFLPRISARRLKRAAWTRPAWTAAIAHTYLSADRSIFWTIAIEMQEYGVATQKDSALSQPVAEAIQGMLDDGTIAELTDKWD